VSFKGKNNTLCPVFFKELDAKKIIRITMGKRSSLKLLEEEDDDDIILG